MKQVPLASKAALLALAAGLALAGCASPTATSTAGPMTGSAAPGRRGVGAGAGSGDLVPLTPPGGATEAVGPTRDAPLEGRVRLARATSLAGAKALARLTTVGGGTLLRDGEALLATPDADGRFAFPAGSVPATPFVVEVALAGGHVVRALVLPDQPAVEVDEASSMVLALLRWRASAPGGPLEGLTAATLADLTARTRALPGPALDAAGGAAPALAAGAEAVLRGAYVKAFADVTEGGDAPTDRLSDAWTRLLGVRPRALVHVGAGLATPGFTPGAPASAGLPGAWDLQVDAEGGLLLTSGTLLAWVPGRARAAAEGVPAVEAGRVYPLLGGPDAGAAATPWAILASDAGVPAGADLALPEGLGPLALEPSGGPLPHRWLAAPASGRVVLIPGAELTRFGRRFRPGRAYLIAGSGDAGRPRPGTAPEADDPATIFPETQQRADLGDGGPAQAAPLYQPMALAPAADGSVFVLENGRLERPLRERDPQASNDEPFGNPDAASGMRLNHYHGLLRVVRAADGRIFSLRPTLDGKPLTLDGVLDLRLARVEGRDWLYGVHSDGHYVFRLPAPDPAALTAEAVAAPIEVVLGRPGEPGLLAAGTRAEAFALARPRPAAEVRLQGPGGLDLDPRGTLFVGDRNGVWRVAGGRADLVAGGVASLALEGDARLATFPATSRVRWSEATRDLYVVDGPSGLLRRIRLARPDASP